VTPTIRYLADTSTLVRLPHDAVAEVLASLLSAGELATCGVIELALLSLIQSPAEYAEIKAMRAASFQWLPTTDQDFHRALAVQALLAEEECRAIAWPQLVVAAVAERHGVSLLHYNPVFEQIAKLTGQAAEWVAAAGSLELDEPP